MMDWLYEELDQNDSAKFQAHVSSCSACDAELRSLERTREAFRQLPHEEPPPGLSAILLHEAAKRAPGVTPVEAAGASGGLLAWLGKVFRPIALHPAAAAVASLVLVAGIAGTMWVTRGDHVARPSATSAEVTRSLEEDGRLARSEPVSVPAAVPEPESEKDLEQQPQADSPTQKLDDGETAEGRAVAAVAQRERAGDANEDGYAADLLAPSDQTRLRKAAKRANRDSRPASPSTTAEVDGKKLDISGSKSARGRAVFKANEKARVANAVTGADQLVIDDDADQAAPSRPSDKGGVKDSTRAWEFAGQGKAEIKTGQTRTEKTKPPSKAEPPASPPLAEPSATTVQRKPPEKKPSGKQAQIAQTVAKPTADKQAPQAKVSVPARREDLTWAKSQRAALTRAHKNRDCIRAGKIANDLLDRAPNFYNDNVKRSREVKECSFYVREESARRAKRTKTATKKSKAKPAKAVDTMDADTASKAAPASAD